MPNKVFKLVIDVDARKAKRGAAETTTAFNKLNQAVQQYGKYAAAAGVAAAAMFARRSIRAAIVQAQAVAQVAAAIESTGMAAGFAVGELEEMSAALQRQTTIGDEAILKMQSLLLTFKSVRGEQFERATEAIVNMSARMGSLESNALLLGKALDDPARRASELSRSGIVLTQTQIALVKQLEATGQRAKAQGIILEEVATQFGGAAKAAADAAGGGIEQFKNAAGDLSEVLGARLVPALDALGKRFAAVAGSGEFNTFVELLFRGARAAVNFATGLDDAREKMDRFAKSPFVTAVVAVYKALTDVDGQLIKFSFDTYNASQVSDELGASLDRVERELLAEERALIRVQGALEMHRDALENIEDKYREDIAAIRAFYEELAKLEAQMDGMSALTDELFGYKGEAGGGPWEETIDGMIDEFTEAVMGSKPKGAIKVFGETLKDNVGTSLAGAIGVALGGGSTDAVIGAFAGAIGAAVGQALTVAISASMGAAAGPIGMIGGALVGALMGKLLGSVFGGDTGGTTTARLGFGTDEYLTGTSMGVRELAEELKALDDTMAALERTIGGTVELTESFNVATKENGRVWLNLFDEIGRQVGSIEFDSVQNAISAGMAHVLSSAIVDAEGPMADAISQVLAKASARGYEQTIGDVELLSDLDAALGGFSVASDSILQSIHEVQRAIEAMGLSASTAAPLLAKVADAEADRNKELRAGAFSNLADMLERAGIRQMEADRFRAQVEQQLFQLQLKKLEAEFRALDMWNELLENIFDDLNQFAKSIGNFTQQIEEVTEDLSNVVDSTGDWLDNWKKVQAQFRDFANSVLLSGFQLRYRQILSTIKDWEERLRAAGAGASQDLRDYLKDVLKPALIKKAWQQFLQPLVDFQEQAKTGALSTSSLQEKYAGSRAKFFDLVERARAGDQDAIQALAGASQDYLQLAQQMFGTTDAYKRIFDEVMSLIDGILSDDDLMRKVIDEQHDEMMMLLELNGTTAHELAQMQVDELVKIRRELQQQTEILWDQGSVLERLEVN